MTWGLFAACVALGLGLGYLSAKVTDLQNRADALTRRVAALEEAAATPDPVPGPLAGGVAPEGPVALNASPSLNRMPRPRTMRDVTSKYERNSRIRAAAAKAVEAE